MLVFKFGGASVRDAAAIQNVASILSLYPGKKLTVVVSAMGKSTNKLEEIVEALETKNHKLFSGLVDELEEFHMDIMAALFPERHFKIYQTIEELFEKLRSRYEAVFSENKSFEYDQVVSLGEVLSSQIVSAYLIDQDFSVQWMDARKLIRTDHSYQEGKVDWKKTEQLVRENMLPSFIDTDILLTQGFVGHTLEGFTTTLGREGSDYTAGILAYCSEAESVTIWKDVPGMLNADPKYFENTKKLEAISFKEAIELSYYGASVIHPKTIQPLQNRNIPLYVKSFLDPKSDGTVIQASSSQDHLIPSYIFKFDQALYSFTPKDFSFIVEENLSVIFGKLSDLNVKINLMQNSALSFSILVDQNKVKRTQLLELFQKEYEVKYNEDLSLVTIRHYDEETINQVTKGKEVLLQQRTRHTARFVLK
ncbi:MAG: aspartate kinase [Crocinitomicaceae bacterium]|jgi:aspartate kinase|nr:aspartate kinase [Crocinitomicaceae bacterium]